MSVVKINVITVPEGRTETLEQRFAARAGEVEHVDGFESFDLLRPTAGTDRYLVVTKWRDDASFEAWMNSASFQRGHAQSGGGASAASGDDSGAGERPAAPGDDAGAGERPAASGAELWAFEVVTSATGTRP